MPARWRMAVAILSVAIFLATGILWVRSYFIYDELQRFTSHGNTVLATSDGALGLLSQKYLQPMPPVQSQWRFTDFKRQRGQTDFLESLIDFRWRPRTVTLHSRPGSPGPAVFNLRVVTIFFPMWPLILPPGGLLLWLFFRGRRTVRWSIRDDVAWMNFRLRRRIGRFAIFSVVGAAAGALLGWIDVTLNLWRSSWEWMATLAVLLPIVSFLVILTRRRIPWRLGLLWMALEIAGCVCFFIATLQESWHVLGGYSLPDAELAPVALFFGAASFVISAALLLVLQLKPQPVKPGPYCPACGYCLIGSPRKICPECGRAFTLEELGISEEELSANSKLEIRNSNQIRNPKLEFRA